MMTEIVRARSALTPYFNDVRERTPYHFKRDAIQNCIYGVDIDPGAIEIAKLRLWLSLVVDEQDVKQIKPLPNLFYKIVTGNSLLGVEKTLFNEKLFRRLEELKPRYFDEPNKEKKDRYRDDIDEIIHELTNGKETFDFEIYFSEVFHRKGGFDVIVANPPYISYYSNTGNTLSDSQRVYIVEHFDSVQKSNDRINSMNLFAEKGLRLLRQEGHESLITNKTLAVLPSYVAVRNYLLKNSTVEYLATNLDPFEAIVDCIVIGITKRKPTNNYKFRWFNGQIVDFETRDIEKFSRNRKLEFHFAHNEEIVQKVELADGKLEDLVIVNRGVNIGGCFKHFLSSTKRSRDFYKYLSGTRSISRFGYEWNATRDGFFVFDTDKEASLRAQGETLVLGNHDRFLQDRLFIPESGQTLMCAYASERIYSAYGIMVATARSKKFNLKYACALLNSRLLGFYAIEREILRKGQKATPHVGVRGLNSIPVWLLSEDDQKPIVAVVDRILVAKQRDPEADTRALEREVDQLVYALYGLTPEEIKTVECASNKHTRTAESGAK
jgi:hypothetical protein